MRRKLVKQTYGSDSDKSYIKQWCDLVYEEALNFALKLQTDIAWNRLAHQNLGKLIDCCSRQFMIARKLQVEDS